MEKLNKIFKILLVFVLGLFLVNVINVKTDKKLMHVNAAFEEGYNGGAFEGEELVKSVDGASIRTEGVQGLRFYAEVLVDNDDLIEKGFYLIYGEANIIDLEEALNNPKVGDYYQHQGKDIFKVIVPGVTSENKYSVVLTDIPVKGYLDKLTAIPFAVNKENNIEYATPVTRSIGEVAIKLEEVYEEMPKGIETALAGFTKVLFVEDNMEISKGLKDDDDKYVDLDLYEIYHPETEEIDLKALTKPHYNFLGWYRYDESIEGPLTSIDLSSIAENLILYSKWEIKQTKATLKYSGETKNMTGDNDADLLGLDPEIFDVRSDKNTGNNHIGLNANGRLQIYQTGGGAILSVEIDDDYLITEIKIKFLKAKEDGADAKIMLGGVEAPNTKADDITDKTITFNDLEITKFSIQNVHSSNVQLWIDYIEITYSFADVEELIDSIPPVITISDALTNYAVGETFNIIDALTWATAIDDIDGAVLVSLDDSLIRPYLDINNKFTAPGVYELVYSASDSAGNIRYKSLFITVDIKYNVTFLLDNDEELKTLKVKEGETVKEENLDLKEGYEFIGWFYEGDLFDFETEITEDIILIARWSTKVYSLTLSNGLESNQVNNNVVLYGSLVTLTIHTHEGLEVKSLIINDVDVTSEIINNEYQFTLTSNTTAILNYDYIVTSTEFKSKDKKTDGVDGNINNYLTLSDPNINVIFNKNNGSTNTIFNNDNKEIRLYPGSENGGSLLIKVAEGYEIIKVLIDIANTNAGFSVNGNGNYTFTKSSQTIELLNPSSNVEIKNIVNKTGGSENQVQIKSITVMYKEEGNTIDFTPPEITLKEDVNLIFDFSDEWDKDLVEEWIEVWDAVDGVDVDITINDEDVLYALADGMFDQTGNFEVIVTATDSSGNMSSLTIKIRVYESLESMLAGIDYSEISYYDILNSIDNDILLIEEMAYLLRDTIRYQTYDKAKYVYAYYDNGKQVVFYDYDGRDGYGIDGTYQNVQQAWGDGGHVTLSNGKTVKLEREHVWACSDMLIKPANLSKSNTEYVGYLLNLDKEFDYRPNNNHRGHYSDLHNLWLSIGSANGTHSNYFYGEENGPSDAYYLANKVFYPGEEYVGDIARILFYMTLMYPHLTLVNKDDPNAGLTGSIYYGYLDVLLYWNEIDPPSEYEIARNELIFNTQGNRNPFIDFYEQGFAEGVFFGGDPDVEDKLNN